jgi:membrane-associated phospholipid phosphatase
MRASGKRFGVLVVAVMTLAAAPLRAQSSDDDGSLAPFPSPLAPSSGDLSRFLPKDTFQDEGRRTMGAFGKNLGRNFVGVFAKDNLGPFLIGASLTGASSYFDQGVQTRYGTNTGGILASPGSLAGGPSIMLPMVGGLFLAGRVSHNGTFRAATYDMAQAFIVNSTYTEILKRAVGRERPDQADNKSFPSGHTSNAFALATVANAHFGAKVGIPAYLAAGAIGLARVDANKHNLSDVVAGAALGYIVGRTVVKQDGTTTHGRHRRFQLVPSAPPSGAGVGAGVSVDW